MLCPGDLSPVVFPPHEQCLVSTSVWFWQQHALCSALEREDATAGDCLLNSINAAIASVNAAPLFCSSGLQVLPKDKLSSGLSLLSKCWKPLLRPSGSQQPAKHTRLGLVVSAGAV